MREGRLKALMALSRAVSSSLDVDEVLRAVIRAATEITGSSVSIWTAEEVASTFDPETLDEATRTRQPIRMPGLPPSYGIPIVFQDSVLGVFSYCPAGPSPDGDEAHELLAFLADQAAVAIRNAKLFAESRRREREMVASYDLARRLSTRLGVEQILDDVVDGVIEALGCDGAASYRWDEARGGLVYVRGRNHDEEIVRKLVMRPGQGACGRAYAERRPVWSRDWRNDPALPYSEEIRRLFARSSRFRAYLAVPILFRGEVVGVLGAHYRDVHTYTAHEVEVLGNLANLAATAIENARLHQESEARRHAAEALAEVTRGLTQSLEPDVVARRVLDSINELLGTGFSALVHVDRESGDQTVVAVSSDHEEPLRPGLVYPRHTGVVGRAVAERQPVSTPNLLADPRIVLTPETRALLERAPYRAILAVPLILKDEVVGGLSMADREGRVFRADEVRLAQAFADQAALALQNAHILQELKTRQERLEALLEVAERRRQTAERLADLGRLISQSLDLQHVAQHVVDSLRTLVPGLRAALYRTDPVTNDHHLVADSNDPAITMAPQIVFRRGTGTVGLAVRERRLVVTPNLLDDPRFQVEPDLRAYWESTPIRASAAVPLLGSESILGVLTVGDREGRVFSDEELRILEMFAAQATVALENARLFAAVKQRAQALETLARVTPMISRATNRAEVFEFITRSARELLGAKLAHLWVQRPGTPGLTMAASSGREGSERPIPLDPGLIERIATSRRAEVLTSFAGMPLVVGETLVGVLAVLTGSTRVLTTNDKDVLKIFADQAAIAIERARLYERLADKTQRLEVLNRLALGLTVTMGQQEVFATVARAALKLFGDVGCSLWVLDGETEDLTLVADQGIRSPELRETGVMKLGQGLIGAVIADRRAMVLDDIQQHSGPNQAFSQAEGFHAAMAVPLLFGERCFGGLSVRRRSMEPFRAEDVDLLTALAGHAAITIEQARLYEDITRTNAHLQEQARVLEIKNAELDSFAYAVSHDLKAPLVTLQGMAGCLAEDCGGELGEEGRHYLSRIAATIKQMERLIEDVLMLCRIGREGRQTEVVALDEVADEVLDGLAERLRARDVKVTRGDLGTVQAIRTQMEQVFSNLVGNAVKYLGDAADPAIEIGRLDRGAGWELFVRDNGVGIDPAYHTRIFEAFQRLKEVPAEGTGVGLAIVKKIVETAGGRVWVESAAGQGATFFFTWPHLPPTG